MCYRQVRSSGKEPGQGKGMNRGEEKVDCVVVVLEGFSSGSGARFNDTAMARLTGRLDIFPCELNA